VVNGLFDVVCDIIFSRVLSLTTKIKALPI